MWYRNFIVFVIFVVVDKTISGKVCTLVKGLARTDSKAVVSACFAVDGMVFSWVFTFFAFARSFVFRHIDPFYMLVLIGHPCQIGV